MKQSLFIALMILAFNVTGCKTTTNGTANVVVYKGAVESIQRPQNGIFTTMSWWRENYEINLRTFTEEAKDIKVFTKDNTPIILGSILVTAHTEDDDATITKYISKFGIDEKARHENRMKILKSQTETEARKAFSKFDAYDVYANQDAIQQDLFSRLKTVFSDEIFLALESVQFGNWHFENSAIEAAASAVVANRKQKEAEQAGLDAALVNQKKKEVDAQVFSNPALLKIEVLRYQLAIEQARATGVGAHQGPLTIIYGSSPQTTLQLQQEK